MMKCLWATRDPLGTGELASEMWEGKKKRLFLFVCLPPRRQATGDRRPTEVSPLPPTQTRGNPRTKNNAREAGR